MLSISPIADLEYYLELAAEDYFLNGGEPPGIWVGSARPDLGVSGKLANEDFRSIFSGYRPGGKDMLVQNAGKKGRRPGFDHTFSAPKSVSVIWATADREVQEVIQQLQQTAVESALAHLEDHLAFCRTGKAGSGSLKPARIIAATFEHGTSRAEDPQLHTHALIANVGFDEEGKSRSLFSLPLFDNKKLLGAYYRAELARLLEKTFGLRMERYGDSFDVVGVSKEITDHFSKRRKEVLAAVGRDATAIVSAIATLETRRTKKNVPPRAELFERWIEEVAELLRNDPSIANCSIEALGGNAERDTTKLMPLALKEALQTSLKTSSHFSQEDFLFQALCAAPERGLSPDKVVRAATEFLRDSEDLIKLDLPDGSYRFTSKEMLLKEKQLLDDAYALLQRPGASISEDLRQDILDSHAKLTYEQRTAVDEILGSTNSLRFLHGMAGTGKTSYVLKACVKAWQKQGYEVIGAAPTGRAAIELEESAGIETSTIHSLLADYDPGGGFKAKHHLKQLVRAAKGKRTYQYRKPRPKKLSARQILIVDESGMVNLRHNQMLFDEIKRSGATIVFTGDPYQLSPVEGTAPFLSLSQRCGYSKLEDIQRQVDSWARDAARYFAIGQPGKALALYAKRKQIRVRDTKDAAIQQMVLDWTAEGLTTPEKAVILCTTNAECQAANELCQRKSLEVGWLQDSQSIRVRDEQKLGQVFESDIYVHDRVIFTKNSKKFGVQNGTLGVVTAMDSVARKLAVRLDNGKTVRIPLKRYSNIRLGYALTTYRAQGGTFDHAYVLAGGAMQDLPTTYVQATRARLSTTFYGQEHQIDEYLQNVDESPLAKQMATRPDLSMAADLLQPADVSSSDRDELLNALVSDYITAISKGTQNSLILTRTKEQAAELNDLCHERLAHQNASTLETANGLKLVPGDRVTFNQPPYMTTNIKRGERARIAGVDEHTGIVHVVFDEEKLLLKQEALALEAKRLDLARAHALAQEQANQSASNVEEIYNYYEPQRSSVTQDYATHGYAHSNQPQYTYSQSSIVNQPFSVATSNGANQTTKQYDYAYQGAGANHLRQQMEATNQQFNTFTQQSTQTQYQAITHTNGFGQAY